MVLLLVVLEFDMQTILDAHLHLNVAVRTRLFVLSKHPDVLLFRQHRTKRFADFYAEVVTNADIHSIVALVLLRDLLKREF